ncbi:MAG: hydroxymethylglutaryl-CoA reductase, degradative [Myxococcota bacterium]
MTRVSSALSGFYKLSVAARRASLAEAVGIGAAELETAFSGDGGLSDEAADRMVENVLGVMGLPLGLCCNLVIDGVDRLVPMSVEEPSVVAAASFASKLLRAGGGVTTEVTPPHMVGQIQILDVPDAARAAEAILADKAALIAEANSGHPNLVGAGGGAVDVEVHQLDGDADLGDDPCGPMTIVHVVVDVRDAMGANAINSMCERLAPRVEALSRGRVGLRILSNLTDRRRVIVRGKVPFRALQGRGHDSPAQLARAIVEASVFAERDPYRAATHNKGIMNGVDSVLIAFGQDWRAVEAGAHAYAARDGRYTALARWRIEGDHLVGTLELPLAVGTVGGVANVHPSVKMARAVARVEGAADLARLVAAVGLAQNLSALRALAAEGIQRGHMRLHARNFAVEAGATGDAVEEVARTIADRGTVSLDAAREALEEIGLRRREASTIPPIYRDGGGDLLTRFADLREAYWPEMARLIDDVVTSTTPGDSSLVSMCAYHMETGGKRLRALLPLLVAEAFETDHEGLLPFGAACEMLHNATLVHDDLQDGDLVRRGRMTVWNRYGQAQAINLGDAMFYFAVLLCHRTRAPAARRETLVRRLLLDTLQVIDGQEREFALKGDAPPMADYFRMVEGKTSGLFALPMAGAAQFCGAEEGEVADLAEAARHLGVLFQIQDDVLDLYGDKGRGAKGSDVAEGKRSVLAVHALNALDDARRLRLRDILDRDRDQTKPDEIRAAIDMMTEVGSLTFALDEIRRRRERALGVPVVAANPRLRALVAGMSDLFTKPIADLMNA